MIHMGFHKSIVVEFKVCMMKKFEMSDLDLSHYILGLEVKLGVDGIFISQRKYAMDLLKKFNIVNYKVAAIPMNVNEKLNHDDNAKLNAIFFSSLIGGMYYLSHTIPDIALPVGVLS